MLRHVGSVFLGRYALSKWGLAPASSKIFTYIRAHSMRNNQILDGDQTARKIFYTVDA